MIAPMTSEGASRTAAPRRGPVFGSRYAVATDHPLVSLAAMNVLQRGGNAVDAAIAAAFVNVVTKPDCVHPGGDAFSLIWRRRTNEVDCLNAGGRAPHGATLDLFADGIPSLGARASTVPGLVDALLELHVTYATLPLEALLAPAVHHAKEGFPVSQRLSRLMATLAEDASPQSAEARSVFLKVGAPYAPGETLRQPELSQTLRRIAEDEREGFYGGETAERIAREMAAAGGLIDKDDLAEQTAVWSEPIKTAYAGCEVYEQALPSQGIILLEALNIVEAFPLRDWGAGSADAIHVMVEVVKMAFADRRRYAADPLVEEVPLERLLSKEHGRARAAEIDLRVAKERPPALLAGDTTEFVVGDEEMAVAFIQSIFAPWGSRFVVPGTGVLMNNRLRAFSLDPANPNHLAPGKRAMHTLNTFMALHDGRLVVGGGTPGADYQVQSNLQSLVGVLDWGMDLQSTVDIPRWGVMADGALGLEGRFPDAVFDDLAARGHLVARLGDWDVNLAKSQLIASTATGGWAVASDLRGEGVALGH